MYLRFCIRFSVPTNCFLSSANLSVRDLSKLWAVDCLYRYVSVPSPGLLHASFTARQLVLFSDCIHVAFACCVSATNLSPFYPPEIFWFLIFFLLICGKQTEGRNRYGCVFRRCPCVVSFSIAWVVWVIVIVIGTHCMSAVWVITSLCTHCVSAVWVIIVYIPIVWVLFGWYLFRCQLHECRLGDSSYVHIAWVLFGW